MLLQPLLLRRVPLPLRQRLRRALLPLHKPG
jgi:hypothetical protein